MASIISPKDKTKKLIQENWEEVKHLFKENLQATIDSIDEMEIDEIRKLLRRILS